MPRIWFLVVVTVGCGTPQVPEKPVHDGTPKVIVDKNRKVMDADLVVTEQPRNACTLGVKEYILQYVPNESNCGEIPDEVGDMRDLDPAMLSIPRGCTLGHYFSQDEECTVTTELTCETPGGCSETRYQDFDWTPGTDGRAWYGDGLLKLTRMCDGIEKCRGTYHVAVFPRSS